MRTIIYGCFCFTALLLGGCRKFLEEKPNKQLVIPATLSDVQALLDNYEKLNMQSDCSALEASADNYYVTTTDFNAMLVDYRRTYLWEKDFLFPTMPNNWSTCYDQVYIANTALEALDKIEKTTTNATEWNNIQGQALFWRAKAMQQLAFGWCLAYDETSANNDLGLPLRLNSNFNEVSVRSSVKETYQQLLSDLMAGAALLPNRALALTRPSKAAAFGLLARTYLSMRKYEQAGKYADSSLQLYSTLLDYNAFNAAASFPMPSFNNGNTEIIFESRALVPTPLNNSISKTDSLLYNSYAVNDTRKTLFFKNNNNGSFGFKGSYEGSGALFTGLATDEMYLTRAECFARAGNITAAMNDLNTLLVKRWKTGTFISFSASTTIEAVQKVLTERRKQLLYRNWRWMDIKRLNKEGANIVLKRIINSTEYVLPPNDLRYALPIPEQVIELSGMQQNLR